MSPPADVTALLLAWNRGDEDARSALMTAVYAELRRMAARRLRSERSGHSLAATALVHETYLKLVNQTRVRWQNRGQFFALASHLMRRVLVDPARAAWRRNGALAAAQCSSTMPRCWPERRRALTSPRAWTSSRWTRPSIG